jgi:hypothetical protein
MSHTFRFCKLAASRFGRANYRSRPLAARHQFHPALEALEDRCCPSAFTVNTLADTGAGSGLTGDLRYCMTQANLANGSNTIMFQPGLSGTILLHTVLPTITNNLTIDGPQVASVIVNGNKLGSVFNVAAGETVSISNLTITGGNSNNGGGGILNNGTLTVDNCYITGNSGGNGNSGGGGGMLNFGTLTVSNCFISNCNGRIGGGIWNNNNAVLMVSNSTLKDNTATDGPGGIENLATLTVNYCTLSHNTGDVGGAIESFQMLTLSNSTISDNSADVGGGLINEGTMLVSNCTISGNQAQGLGGGIDNLGTAAILNSTISGNSVASGKGGGIAAVGSTVTLHDTIVAGNKTLNGNIVKDFAGTVSATVAIQGVTYNEGFNLIGDGTGSSGFTNGDQVGNSANPIDPKLGPLQNNGGQTATQALLPRSPAINAGDPNGTAGLPAFDQRGFGFPRIVDNRVDIGAFESQVKATLSNDPQTNYVIFMYETVLNRLPDANGLQAWVQFIYTGGTRQQVAQGFWESAEHRGMEIDLYYATFLHRSPDAAGRLAWIQAFASGMNETQVQVAFLTSPEYILAHADIDSFAAGLYSDVFGRTPDPGALAAFEQMDSLPLGRSALAAGFLNSTEELRRIVDRNFSNILGRGPDQTGEAFWLGALQTKSLSPSQVAEAFLTSDESFAYLNGGAG